jgi:predicted dehydrogenase
MGPAAEVHAVRYAEDWRAVTANIVFENGSIGSLTLATPGGNWEELTILGSEMNAVKIKDGIYCTIYSGNDPCGGHTPSFAASGNGSRLMGFVGEFQEFIDAIAEERTPEASIEKVTDSIALYEAIVRSLEKGSPETVERREI